MQATNSTNSITIRKTSRTHNTTPNFKSTISNRIEMKISNDVNSYSDRCIIGFKESATEAFDLEFDSHKLYGNATAPSLSSKIGNEVFSTNYLTPLESSYDLKLEFKAGVNANYQLLFEGLSSLDSDIFVTLEDLKTGTFVNVNSTSVYDFAASTADTPDRFIVHLFKSPLGVDDLGKSNLKVYAHNNLVTVQNELNSEGSIQIYDLSGRIIFEQTLSNQQFNSYRIDAPNGVYILQVMAGANSINEKIIIANN
ncbi:MAG: T9SS type A sorting domain-containing protein [Bacteroidales bacterium]|nr:T9SS type A sorting domain-containing protein [Bacteroidales bacterium]